MLTHFLKIFFLIGGVISSNLREKIYGEEREKILAFVKRYYKAHGRITRLFNNEVSQRIKILGNFNANDLLNELNAEDSDLFVVIFLFGYRGKPPVLIFPHLSSLCQKYSSSQKIPLKRIFKNFRILLFNAFVKANMGGCTNSSDSTECYKLLRKFENFWNHRLEHLAGLLLNKDEFIKQSKLTKERISFLDLYLDCGLQFLLIREYKKLHQDIQTYGIKNAPAIKNFIFLAARLAEHLHDINSPTFLELFEWLASQTPKFIIYCCYFMSKSRKPEGLKTPRFSYLISGDFEKMRKLVGEYIHQSKVSYIIFGCLVIDHPKIDEITKLADIILKRTAGKITN